MTKKEKKTHRFPAEGNDRLGRDMGKKGETMCLKRMIDQREGILSEGISSSW